MAFELIISDIDAGGGDNIDLYFDAENMRVKEEKNFVDGSTTTNEYHFEDFEEDVYGEHGQEFLDKIGME